MTQSERLLTEPRRRQENTCTSAPVALGGGPA